ncbi:MAG: hypothetical protein ACLT76_01510 [Clostridium fessum]
MCACDGHDREMATAIANGLTAYQLSTAMRAHPTYSEANDGGDQRCVEKWIIEKQQEAEKWDVRFGRELNSFARRWRSVEWTHI